MITLDGDRLVFRFETVHEAAECRVHLQRTLRIPDDGREYPLPPGLGPFPLRHLDDFASRLDPAMAARGGVIVPMWQAEALWIAFAPGPHAGPPYPFALKIATGKIDAVSGERWAPGLNHLAQNYVVVPAQPWLDGYCVEKGVIRQFIAMPLGQGYSAEEQITGAAEFGGIQIQAFPMKAARYEKLREAWRGKGARVTDALGDVVMPLMSQRVSHATSMGIAPGGRMRQHIYEDEYGPGAWELDATARCFITILNSADWQAVTGHVPPTQPPTAKQYSLAGLPWFDYYSDAPAVSGGSTLSRLKSVVAMGKEKGEAPLPENESVEPAPAVPLGPGPRRVREAIL
jgi:hypothetical protein